MVPNAGSGPRAVTVAQNRSGIVSPGAVAVVIGRPTPNQKWRSCVQLYSNRIQARLTVSQAE